MSSASVVLEYERVWSDGMNRGDVSAADLAFHPDCTFHFTGVAEPMRGVQAWKAFVAAFLAAFPDLHLTVDEQIVDGDRVATRWHGCGDALDRMPSREAEVDACFERAMTDARARAARSLALRAASSAARTWIRRGERERARAVLQPSYEWITEGFETPDLVAARALLDSLR